MASLELNHVYKVYPNGVKAVNDFTMQIKDKEFIVFVGPSGCGKSTTLRMIAGLEEITTGDIKIDNLIINDAEPKERDIAMVFQNYALYPHMTVYKNMAFGLKLRHMPKDEIDKRVREAAEILGITDYLQRKPKAMSGGQRQRVALGRAIVREPKVFLLDEPLSNLDAKLRANMRSEISKLHHKLQTTFIYVTHDQIEAMTMADRIVVMKDGFVQQIGTPRDLYRFPINKFVAGFIGTPQMNFMNVTLKENDDKVLIKFADVNYEVEAPRDLFSRVDSKYLNGETALCLGLRSEHIHILNNDGKQDSKSSNKYIIKAKVSTIEELGVDCQVYADLNLDNNEIISDSKTRILIKAPTGSNIKQDTVVDISLDLEHMHIFDTETEESVNPVMPKYVKTTVNFDNGVINMFGENVKCPAAINLENGQYEMEIPTSYVTPGETISGEVIQIEQTSELNICVLKNGGGYLYVSYPNDDNFNINVGDKVKVDIDLKACKFVKEDQVVEPLCLSNVTRGTYIRNNIKVQHYNSKDKPILVKETYVDIKVFNSLLHANAEQGLKMVNLKENKVFKDEFSVEFTPYDVKFVDEGIPCEIVKILDYGKELFAVVTVGEEIVLVLADENTKIGPANIEINVNNIACYEDKHHLRLI